VPFSSFGLVLERQLFVCNNVTMRKTLLFVVGFVLLVTLGLVWYFTRYIPPEVPELSIPGLEAVSEVERDYSHVLLSATVKYLGNSYVCSLDLKIGSDSKLILPTKDQVFTAVISEEDGLELWRDNRKIGKLPIVFISDKNGDGSIYLVGPAGESLRPVFVKSGMVNLATFKYDTIIRGQEGVRVQIYKETRQIDDGKLPMMVRLGDKTGRADIKDGLQVWGIGGIGVFNVYAGYTQLKKGQNEVMPIGRFTGSDAWFDKGKFLGASDVAYALSGEKVNIIGEVQKEVAVPGIDISLVDGDPVLADGSIVLGLNGKLVTLDKTGAIKELGFAPSGKARISGNFIISGKDVFDTKTGKTYKVPDKYDFLADGVFVTTRNEKLLTRSFVDGSLKTIWEKPCKIGDGPSISIVSGSLVFLYKGDRCTEFFDVGTGKSGYDQDLLVEKPEIEVVQGEGLCFPSGLRIKNGIVCVNQKGKMVWGRAVENQKRFGAFGVWVNSKTTAVNTIYDVRNGNEIMYWEWPTIVPKIINAEYLCFVSGNDHTVFVKRTLKK